MTSKVHLYDLDYNLAHTVDADDVITVEPGLVVLPTDHPAAKWLLSIPDQPARGAHAVTDSADGRWSGRLTGFEVRHGESGSTLVARCLVDPYRPA